MDDQTTNDFTESVGGSQPEKSDDASASDIAYDSDDSFADVSDITEESESLPKPKSPTGTDDTTGLSAKINELYDTLCSRMDSCSPDAPSSRVGLWGTKRTTPFPTRKHVKFALPGVTNHASPEYYEYDTRNNDTEREYGDGDGDVKRRTDVEAKIKELKEIVRRRIRSQTPTALGNVLERTNKMSPLSVNQQVKFALPDVTNETNHEGNEYETEDSDSEPEFDNGDGKVERHADVEAKLKELNDRVRNRMRAQTPTALGNLLERTNRTCPIPVKQQVKFTQPDVTNQASPKGYEYETEDSDSERELGYGGGDVECHADVGAKLKEFNDRDGSRMRAQTPTALSNILERNQQPRLNLINNTNQSKQDSDNASISYEDSDADVEIDMFDRPPPVGSSTPDKAMPISDEDTAHTNEPLIKYDSDEDRCVTTRCTTRWSDILDDINTGRESAKPMALDFYSDSSSSGDLSSDKETKLSDRKLTPNALKDKSSVNITVQQIKYDSDEDRGVQTRCTTRWSDVMKDINAGRGDEIQMTCDLYSKETSSNERNQDKPSMSVFFDSDSSRTEDLTPKKEELLQNKQFTSNMAIAHRPVHIVAEQESSVLASENTTQRTKTKRQNKMSQSVPKKKKKPKKEQAKLPENCYKLRHQQPLPPIGTKEGDPLFNKPRRRTPVGFLPEIEKHESQKNTIRSGKRKSNKKKTDRQEHGLEKCIVDLPMQASVFEANLDPDLANFETRSQRVANFRAQFNKQTKVLSAIGHTFGDDHVNGDMVHLGEVFHEPEEKIVYEQFKPTAPAAGRPQVRRALKVKLPSEEEQEKLKRMMLNTDVIPKAPSAKKPDIYRGKSDRLSQAAGLQNEVIRTPAKCVEPNVSKAPNDNDIMKRKFQLMFKSKIKGGNSKREGRK